MIARQLKTRPGHGRRSLAAGFSVIELLVVVTIMGLLAGIAAPPMRGLMAAQRVRATASDLHLSLLRARSEAIKRNRDVKVERRDDGWEDGWNTEVIPRLGDPPEDPILQKQDATAKVSIVATPDTLTQLVYSGTGRTTLAVGTESKFVITAANTSFARCVLVDNSGRPYVKEGSAC